MRRQLCNCSDFCYSRLPEEEAVTSAAAEDDEVESVGDPEFMSTPITERVSKPTPAAAHPVGAAAGII